MANEFNKIVAALKEKRQEIASLKKIEVFKILQNKTIEEIAQVRPQTVEELAKIKGIGQAKLVQYGEIILKIVKKIISENNTKSQEQLQLSDNKSEVGAYREERTEEKTVFSVSEFLAHLNSLLSVREYVVQGEISELKSSSYSVYFSLKDKKDGSLINCYMSQWKYNSLGVSVVEGMEVKLTGYPEIYKQSGRLSLIVNGIEPIGEGALRKAYELLKKKLETEGLFVRKRSIPEFIERIGVISSKNGVVIQDFRKNLKARGYKIFFFDSRVEGPEAVAGIVRGIKILNRQAVDLIVIMRGGGSLESMQAFNNENVVRAIFASDTPVLCGIGHDVDVPIASMVADLSVSTPTATAHTINQSWDRLEEGLPILSQGLLNRFERILTSHLNIISSISEAINNQVERLFQRIASAGEGIVVYFSKLLDAIALKVNHAEKILSALNPENQLKLGYSIVSNQAGKVIKNIDAIKIGDMIRVRLQKGLIKAEVKDKS